jgi:opacity protein-like surface antigen
MKKLLTITLLAAFGVSNAQGKGKIEMGFNTGLNVAYISDEYGTADSHIGFNLAALADYYFSDAWSVKAKLIYDQKGFDNGVIYDIDSDTDFATNYKFNYLTVPVMASWHFAPKRNWYLHFGPYVGFLISAEDSRFGEDIKDDFNATDFGLAVGLGVKIPLNEKFRLFFEYDAQAGITDIVKAEGFSETTNNRYSLNVGINFLAN